LQIINFLREENEQGKFNILVIDEAQSLSIPMIDELRSFYDEASNFTLILSGLPPLLSKTMNLSVNLPMKQRINLSIETESFTPAQTIEYIKHQLSVVKANTPIFDDKCYPVIHSLTSGIPRKINQLCYKALFQGYIDKKTIVTEDYIKSLYEESPHIFDKPMPV
ncbi:hypothetical protein RBH29_17650, partial [Herbivorax sp. ANBcel31]|uniref:ExeA family protein n=1 Tax=Herbivorax sp. ANBcel31 TaxID=3069754 RepID=UPI0027B4D431